MTPPLFGRRRLNASTDWAWGGLGVTMATVSASFAAYMIATAPDEVAGTAFGAKNFGIFAHWDRRQPAPPAGQHPPLSTTAPVAVATAAGASATVAGAQPPATAPSDATAALAAIDNEPTGSIPDGATTSQAPRSGGSLGEFHLRDVFGNHALIEHRSKLSLVTRGSILAGAGEVLSIERQGRGWVVKTASGVIGGS